LILSGAVLALLFIGNATTDRRDLEKLSFTTGTAHGKPVSIYVPGVGLGSTINPLAPESIHSFAKMITSILFLGPRLATEGFRSFALAGRLAGLDIAGCAAVLAALAGKDGPVPFAELVPAIPAGHDLTTVLTQVQEIEGVRLVTSEPAGLSLFSDLRQQLRKRSRSRTTNSDNEEQPG
jgi:hypothetical protein